MTDTGGAAGGGSTGGTGGAAGRRAGGAARTARTVGDPGGLARALRAAVRGEVDFGAAARALVTMDASNYRRVPLGVVAPRDAEDVAAVLRVCAEAGVPVVPRGGGTSIAGQATGVGVVLDFTRHMTAVLDLDPQARTAVVQPGAVLDVLRGRAAAHGLTFGPDPSTRSRCTLGGMIGNNACGSHSVAWGTTADNVRELTVLRYGDPGGPHRLARGWSGAPAGLPELVAANLALLRTALPRPGLTRRISGYAVDALLPERGVELARAFCGSEGTLGVVTEAVVELVPLPPRPALAVLGYADEGAAAEAAAGLLPYGPLTVEGMAADLVRGAAGAELLPRGRAWLFVEMPDEAAAHEVVRAADAVSAAVLADPARQRALWRIREDAAGTATRLPDGTEAWPGWEDCAVPPARLAGYLRDFRTLLSAHGLRGIPYGHFGEGCIHVRIDFDLASAPGVARFRRFSEELAVLVTAHGGSLSGEHGDGQARAELLPHMYGPDTIRLFESYKDVWDPAGGLNPGMLVRAHRLDENLRFLPVAVPAPPPSEARGSGGGAPETTLARGVVRCVGVARCRSAEPSGTDVMCPSFRVTRDERHSTRGRARLLHEMLTGELVEDSWRSTDVREALDLCLSCKGCRSDCPAGVDMAAYKAEFLHRHWAGRIRPAAHYTMGGLPAWLHLIATVRGAAPANLLGRVPLLRRLGGITPERELPPVAAEPFTRWFRKHGVPAGRGERVLLWPDTFTEHLAPEVGRAAVRVLAAAGIGVELPRGRVCCGLTYLSTGRLDRARAVLRRTLDVVGETGPVAVLEPSCAAALRADLPELLPDDPRAARLAAAVRTFAQVLEERAPHWQPPRLDRAVAGQTHCHQHAVLGDAAERRLRERAGLTGALSAGCCGLAGNFGFERGAGRYAVSVACAEEQLLPAVRAAPPAAAVLADGFSCRTQLAHLSPRPALHMAQLLSEGLVR
ncbi:FAD-binding oxidoreductase [Streptomyces bambusae]|uniref:FAD-binding and (Fe-S)-binding domain-containing protein n=1 Tax=Streptomyces bambusae TaxID=1550616 RepID=UPI001CFE046D|nr:FAD-binding and (Fe-S)-binding domain-containing protein [Streptomyces bambusae]MCB5167616.1 FAD-binding oxidoreductase [Streptomyces bambusae]